MRKPKSLQATRDGVCCSALRFMSFGPACLSSLDHLVRALAFTTFALLTFGLVGCVTRTADYRAIVAQIRNEHVTWDGNDFGLHVRSLGEPEQRVLAAGSPCRPFLIEALGDESRYVAAHVLLTQMEH